MNNYTVIKAETHSPEYNIHKYWSRKPHNVISSFIQQITDEGDLIIDPFCGSGVTLYESKKLNRNAIGFDVNPIAILLSNSMLSPPDLEKFKNMISRILDQIRPIINNSYSFNNHVIKYCTHTIIVKCNKCGKLSRKSEASGSGRSLKCSNCGAKLNFNLENLFSTKITSFTLDNGDVITDSDAIANQEYESNKALFEIDASFIKTFAENRRILAFDGMTTSDLFTKRNGSIIYHLASMLNDIEDKSIRDSSLVLLSASMAQCSRLIASRNNMSTGGPAWSVPGFWVPADHLETNPLYHLQARLSKIIRAIEKLNETKNTCDCKANIGSSIEKLTILNSNHLKAKMVFFDPPYGDSIPYLEFSTMWNSILRKDYDLNQDISVSNRVGASNSWEKYASYLDSSLKEISKLLLPDGRLVVTFNNNNTKAWTSLISALQNNHFKCEHITYQIPAVISAKAQFALDGSYISDIYSVFSKDPDFTPITNLNDLSTILVEAAKYRGNRLSKGLANRILIMNWIKLGIDVKLLEYKDELLSSLFKKNDSYYELEETGTIIESDFSITCKETAKEILTRGPCEWGDIYYAIANATVSHGIPDPFEIQDVLDGLIVSNGKRCLAFKPTGIPKTTQTTLF